MLRKIRDYFLSKLFYQLECYRLKDEYTRIQNIKFKKRGEAFHVGDNYKFHNPQYMQFGDRFYAENRLKIDAIDRYGNDFFHPEIVIGENVAFMSDIHIGAISKISIGDGCLIASKVYISDHSHGGVSKEQLTLSPIERPLVSKGDITIGKNVWIGEGACILPNVVIGENCIIGANAVVTKSFPPNSIIAGVPAKVIKKVY